MRFHFGLCVILALLLLSCSSPESKSDLGESAMLKTFSSDHLYSQSKEPMCKELFDSYCNYLYAPDSQGNLEVKRETASVQILQGDTANQLSQVFVHYAQAKIHNQNSFPKDFNRVLNRAHYFAKLELFLRRKPRQAMTLSERLQYEQLNYELGTIWTAAINETLILRVTAKFPKFYQVSDNMVPIEWELERRRIRRQMLSEISQAVWKNDPNWRKVEQTFSRLQASYLHMIEGLGIDESIKSDWAQRVRDVKLVLPGSIPEISNEECTATNTNAYYYPHLNVLTVCAGDFNSEDILQTVAHEMGHALGLERSAYLFATHSEFGQELQSLRANVCSPKTFSCDKWSAYKNGFTSYLHSLDSYKPQLPEFHQCLKRHQTTKTMMDADVTRLAETIVNDRISDLATTNRFLRITKDSIPTPNGKTQKNPNYLNPCSYYLWSQGSEPVDDELTTMIYFTAEYQCSDQPAPQRLKSAIQTAKKMTTLLMEQSVRIEGEFSDRNEVENAGFSSPAEERFADVLGSYAMADSLSAIPQLWDRRNKFLAGASWLCLEPSLASRFPEESSVESEFANDAHADSDLRRKELFSTPLREAIACEKDFEFNECKLPQKRAPASSVLTVEKSNK